MKPTTKLQLCSLDLFASYLGYTYTGKYYENDNGNKVSFSRMVSVHNGKYFKGPFTTYSTNVWSRKVKLGNEYVGMTDIINAGEVCLVRRVKLQQKKNGDIVTQSYVIEFA